MRSQLIHCIPTLSALLITLLCHAQTDHDLIRSNLAAKAAAVDDLFAEWDGDDRPGATVAVVHQGEIILERGYGQANIEYDIPNEPSTVFHIASVSKQFTVFAILLLEEQGKLSLDDDIRKYLPEVPDFGHTITLRHLASHTSGMRDQWNLLVMAGWRFDDVITKEHVLTLVKQQRELNFEPGQEYFYCNTGFTLLAEVVARISGMSFAEYADRHIFQPLHMRHTLFYDNHQKIVKNRAYSYGAKGDGYEKRVLSYANVGATSLFTTVQDLSLWTLNFKHLTVGSHAIIDKMNTPATLNDGTTFGGALGQFVNDYKGLRQIQHGGADAGYRTYLGRFPDQEFAVIVFSNYAGFNAGGMALKVADIYLEALMADDEPHSEAPERTYITLSTKQLKAYEGDFWNEQSQYTRRMYVREDTLRYRRGENNESPLAPLGEDRFHMLHVNADLVVRFETKDDIRRMIVTIDGGDPIVSTGYTPQEMSAEALQSYAGAYYSPELDATYRLRVEEDQLVANHMRGGDVTLRHIKGEYFQGSRWYFGQVQFHKVGQQVTGFQVTNGRVRNLVFEKRDGE